MKWDKQKLADLKEFLNEKVDRYNRPDFIAKDPISIPHRFSKKQDIEISGLFAAVLAWGQRVTIVNKTNELLSWMGNSPYDFLLHHKAKDLKKFENFRHRTFNGTDTLYFIEFLSHYYRKHESLEQAFALHPHNDNVEQGLIAFNKLFFSLENFP